MGGGRKRQRVKERGEEGEKNMREQDLKMGEGQRGRGRKEITRKRKHYGASEKLGAREVPRNSQG